MKIFFNVTPILIVSFFTASSWANFAAPLLEYVYSPGLPIGSGKHIATQCQVFNESVQTISVDLVTGERTKSQRAIALDPKVRSLIVKAARGEPKIEVGPTDVPSSHYYAWIDENPSHRYILKATGSHIGENTTQEALELIVFINQVCKNGL